MEIMLGGHLAQAANHPRRLALENPQQPLPDKVLRFPAAFAVKHVRCLP
jgi:hypothetical protein